MSLISRYLYIMHLVSVWNEKQRPKRVPGCHFDHILGQLLVSRPNLCIVVDQTAKKYIKGFKNLCAPYFELSTSVRVLTLKKYELSK